MKRTFKEYANLSIFSQVCHFSRDIMKNVVCENEMGSEFMSTFCEQKYVYKMFIETGANIVFLFFFMVFKCNFDSGRENVCI